MRPELTTTSRLQPVSRIADTIARVPWEYTVMGLRLYDAPSTEATAAQPATAPVRGEPSVTSARTTSSPASCSGNPAGWRVTARTAQPCASASSTRIRPVGPLAPKTTIFTLASARLLRVPYHIATGIIVISGL